MENKNKKQYNQLPSLIFTKFKTSKFISVIFMLLSMLLTVFLLVLVILGNLTFSSDQLQNLANFVLNTIFVISALGFTIFSLPLKDVHPQKNEIVFSYIGQTFLLASIAIFAYVVSYCEFLSFKYLDIPSVYFCLMLLLLFNSITGILSSIVAYFNIRN